MYKPGRARKYSAFLMTAYHGLESESAKVRDDQPKPDALRKRSPSANGRSNSRGRGCESVSDWNSLAMVLFHAKCVFMPTIIVLVDRGGNSETQRHQHKQNEIFYTFFSKKNDLISEWSEKIPARKELIFNLLHPRELLRYRETILKTDQRKPEKHHE